VADIVCGIVESGAVSKADREEESSPDGEADGAGSDAFGEGQAKDTDAHTVDYNIAPSFWNAAERSPSFLLVNGLTGPSGKKTSGGAGTHTGHADAQRHTDHTDEPHNLPVQ